MKILNGVCDIRIDTCFDDNSFVYHGAYSEEMTFDEASANFWPDLTDPATVGCLERLVADAWGAHRVTVDETWRGDATVTLWSDGGFSISDVHVPASSWIEALVAMLELRAEEEKCDALLDEARQLTGQPHLQAFHSDNGWFITFGDFQSPFFDDPKEAISYTIAYFHHWMCLCESCSRYAGEPEVQENRLMSEARLKMGDPTLHFEQSDEFKGWTIVGRDYHTTFYKSRVEAATYAVVDAHDIGTDGKCGCIICNIVVVHYGDIFDDYD